MEQFIRSIEKDIQVQCQNTTLAYGRRRKDTLLSF